MTQRKLGALIAAAAVSVGLLVAAAASSAQSNAVPSWCGPKKIKLGFTDGFGGNSWRLVTTASARAEAQKCPSVTSIDYADGQGNTQKAISDIQGMGLCRRPVDLDPRITALTADLEDVDAVAAAVRGTAPTHVFFTTWSRRATEAENCDVNGRMLQNLLDAVATERSVRHVALVTGLKHYLGPFEAYAKAQPDTPFSEEQPRLPYENFYYVQEDVLFAAAARDGFTWSVHRPHTLIGWALGNAMNMPRPRRPSASAVEVVCCSSASTPRPASSTSRR